MRPPAWLQRGTCLQAGSAGLRARGRSYITANPNSTPPAPARTCCPPNAGRGGRYIGPNPLGLQLFGLAGSNTATRWPLNWHLWLPHDRQRIFDTTLEVLSPLLPSSSRLAAVGPAATTPGAVVSQVRACLRLPDSA
jgi:hypothetical protein